MNRMMNKRTDRGFTLVEVMIALAVFAVVSAALIRSAAHNVYQSRLVEDRQIAYWVAENRLSEIRSAIREPTNFPGPSTRREVVLMAGASFDLEVRYVATENRDVLRLEVTVFPEGDDVPLASLAGFLGRY